MKTQLLSLVALPFLAACGAGAPAHSHASASSSQQLKAQAVTCSEHGSSDACAADTASHCVWVPAVTLETYPPTQVAAHCATQSDGRPCTVTSDGTVSCG